MAAPHAAGAAALIAACNPDLSALEVAETVKKSVRKTDSLAGKVASGGVLDLAKLTIPQAVYSVKLSKTSAKIKKGASFTLCPHPMQQKKASPGKRPIAKLQLWTKRERSLQKVMGKLTLPSFPKTEAANQPAAR